MIQALITFAEFKMRVKPKCGDCKESLEERPCNDCGGSGEGLHDGTLCYTCNGWGADRNDLFCENCEGET